ncbi:hypothetical protein D8674_027891 [Pyrus ussuriensis x Pyrus communis]|uniref:Uncharacterized protein n=1 Tax=Pyrus ussuriensis x Pyrus communis TaxID=2448454 RepID=A0A5N5IDK3_9ROSA|nr:hypothetical protein D8674_027891 [Pyrus ussuriensis x Pyrus communis]
MEASQNMLWCAHCRGLIPSTRDNYFTSCSVCGKVLYQSVISTEPAALVKSRGTKNRKAGSCIIVKSFSSDHSQSSKRTLNKGFMSKSSAVAAHKILKKEQGNVDARSDGGAADYKSHIGNQENGYDCSYDGDDEDDYN